MAEKGSRVIFVYTVCADESEAERIVTTLLEERLIVCGNWWPIRSVYRWKGAVENGTEVVLILKTNKAHVGEVEKKTAALHSYETPCIARIPVSAINEPYQQWLEGELKT